ncbi:GTP-binding protein [Mycobacterium sp. CVI_P3]|uniref:GTP-binding protein n=1 Tax=Mycobacterium pinniadriaticum TaxID=2994102 RepID=A0ABT3SIY0_9MYCO|nr:GTP-binding protein [Mycobacterium pinniadriaticum]MCX2933046.1 GTP-binding protein [Mycobacterium pinniadriaticum]MCX2939468.1 GTP-binding protein [Mycobacterium pinniadriaticum]
MATRTTSAGGATIPVIALTGHLGAGKTTLLNHVLRTPDARIGVVVNDFGEINVDAGLISGQIDEPASITGGCICCLPDDGQLDAALARLADPRLRLDAIIVEASGLADPAALARIIGFSEIGGVRDGGVVDVVDAARHFETVDRGGVAPARYGAATLIVVNKLDQIPQAERAATLRRVETRVRERNSRAHIIGATGGRIDPALLYDVAAATDAAGQLSFRDALVDEPAHESGHVHAESVTVAAGGAVDPGRLLELLESPPTGVYRMKGRVAVRHRSATRGYLVNVVGPAVHIARGAAPSESDGHLVAIGTHFDTAAARARMVDALRLADGPASATALRRWQRYLTRS